MRIVGSDEHTYTFGEMLSGMRSIAWRLREENVGHGDRVVLMGENHPSWALVYLGIIYRGAVVVPLDPHGKIETISNFFENSEAKLAFLSDDQLDRYQQVLEKLGRNVPAVVWEMNGQLDTAGAGPPASTDMNGGHSPFSQWATAAFPESFANESPPAGDTDNALLIYTSGTTGTPKGVPLTHGNIVAEINGVDGVLRFKDDEKILSLLPLFHAYLQIVNLWVATTYGYEVGYLRELTPAELASAMKRFQPTILTTVPRLWYLFHKKIFDTVAAKPAVVRALFRSMLAINGALRDTLGVNMGTRFFGAVHASFGGHLRMAISGGSRFDEDVAKDFHRLGFTILQGYGLTETSGAATATYEKDNRVGSVGKPMLGAEVRIEKPDKDGVGEVLIRGAMVFGGYYRNPAATAEAFTEDGWFRSGDLGRFDRDGHLYIVGRAKDVIVLPSGKNVHPEDLEVHYLKCPMVEEMAIIGVADDSAPHAGSEKLAAVVVPDFEYLRTTRIANSKEAIRHALDNLGRELPEYQRVRDYTIRAEPLPRTATRKVKRFQLKQEFESGQIAAGEQETKTWASTPEDEELLTSPAGSAVADAIRQNASEADVIHPAMNLEIDLGLDSLARAEMFAALEMRFGREFSTDEAAAALTVREVIGLVEGAGPNSGSDGSVPAATANTWGAVLRTADDDLPEVRPILRDRPFFAAFAWTFYTLFNLFCRVFMLLEIRGIEHLRELSDRNESNKQKKTPPPAFLICPNHQSFLDPFVLCSNYPFPLFRRIFHVGASEFFSNRLMQWVAKLLNVVPVDPDTQLMKAMKAGAIGLRHGKVLNIYPEGERAFDGDLHIFKKGAAILATELDLPIVPVAMDGLYKVWPRRSWRIRPAKVKILIGKPFYVRDVIAGVATTARSPDDVYAAVTGHLKKTIAEMIDDLRSR